MMTFPVFHNRQFCRREGPFPCRLRQTSCSWIRRPPAGWDGVRGTTGPSRRDFSALRPKELASMGRRMEWKLLIQAYTLTGVLCNRISPCDSQEVKRLRFCPPPWARSLVLLLSFFAIITSRHAAVSQTSPPSLRASCLFVNLAHIPVPNSSGR